MLFLAMGLFGLVLALISVANPAQAEGSTVGGLLVSLLFIGFAAGLWYWGNQNQQARRLEQRHPRQPWLWRDDWAKGRIRYQGAKAIQFWGWAVVLALVGTPVAIGLLTKRAPVYAYPALLIPLLAVLFLGRAFFETRRALKYGPSTFVLDDTPVKLGGLLKGYVLNARLPPASSSIVARLSSIRRASQPRSRWRRLRRRHPTELVLWETERALPVRRGAQGAMIPVEFALPADQDETSTVDPMDQIHWRLMVTADTPGIDYEARFDLPVFGREERPLTMETTPALAAAFVPQEIAVHRTPAGRQYDFYPRYQTAVYLLAAAATLFVLLVGYLFFAGGSTVTRIVAGAAVVVVLGTLASRLFGHDSIVVESDALVINSSLGPFHRTVRWSFADIERLEASSSLQFGGPGIRTRWVAQAIPKSGQKKTLGKTLTDRQEAEWLAEELGKSIGAVP